jgi:hypothetical protein
MPPRIEVKAGWGVAGDFEQQRAAAAMNYNHRLVKTPPNWNFHLSEAMGSSLP